MRQNKNNNLQDKLTAAGDKSSADRRKRADIVAPIRAHMLYVSTRQ
jgi:hypothetical protein